ncbi:ORF5 protein [Armillaria mellea negative strand RNA virus 2]|uniref:ORF5 protein n=1 Tax=Armillaria mellea negative strand RNA virus 2 TaxID=2803971 RepID=A0A8D9PCS1_9MONO|nr:ORF5 protein [Armillaria mellea negative strand RNA virus 2]DAD54831.1 TPA_asm: ORF5 protein [Armillaria mellea negative strand RNA virus 2]
MTTTSMSAITDYEYVSNSLFENSLHVSDRDQIIGYPLFDSSITDDPTVLAVPEIALWVRTPHYYRRGEVAFPRSIVDDENHAELVMASENQRDLTIYLSAVHSHGRWAKYVRHTRKIYRKLVTAGIMLGAANTESGAGATSAYEISTLGPEPAESDLAVLSAVHACARSLKQLALRALTHAQQRTERRAPSAIRRSGSAA